MATGKRAKQVSLPQLLNTFKLWLLRSKVTKTLFIVSSIAARARLCALVQPLPLDPCSPLRPINLACSHVSCLRRRRVLLLLLHAAWQATA